MKKVFKALLYAIAGYVLIAIICQLIPPQKPDFAKLFVRDAHFGNRIQGNEQTVLGYHDGMVRVMGTINPHAAGPPVHVHTNFDEPFIIQKGTLSLLVDGETKTIRSGESFTVPRGTYHTFFNPTDSPVMGIGETPAAFTFVLTQLYGLTNEDPSFIQSPKFLLQLAVWGSDFDSYLQDGPPPALLKFLKFLLLPIAKVCGYQYANEAYFPRPVSGR